MTDCVCSVHCAPRSAFSPLDPRRKGRFDIIGDRSARALLARRNGTGSNRFHVRSTTSDRKWRFAFTPRWLPILLRDSRPWISPTRGADTGAARDRVSWAAHLAMDAEGLDSEVKLYPRWAGQASLRFARPGHDDGRLSSVVMHLILVVPRLGT